MIPEQVTNTKRGYCMTSNKKWLNIIPVAALVIIGLLLVGNPFGNSTAPVTPTTAGSSSKSSPLIATVDGREIYLEEFSPYLGFFACFNSLPLDNLEEDFYSHYLRSYIEDSLITAYLIAQGITVDEEQLEIEVDNFIAYSDRFGSLSAEEFAAEQKKYGFDRAIIASLIRSAMLSEQFYYQVYDSLTIEQLMQSYNDYSYMFTSEEETAVASHILVDTLEEAEEILQLLEEGEDFGFLAYQYSLCPSSSEGGFLGNFPRGAMVPEFDEAVFAMEPDTISPVVKTQFGYHIILLHDIMPPGYVVPFEETEYYLSEQLTNQIMDEIFGTLIYAAEIVTYPW